MSDNQVSDRSHVVLIFLTIFLGGVGIHRFYARKVGTGFMIFGGQILAVVMLFVAPPVSIVLWIVIGLWLLVDLIKVLIGKFTDDTGAYISSAAGR